MRSYNFVHTETRYLLQHVFLLVVVTTWLTATSLALADTTEPFKSDMLTKWGENVTADNAWQAYPRPTLVRKNWKNLNGPWDYAITSLDAEKPRKWDGRILVPFCVESKLSGVQQLLEPENALWYHRTIELYRTPDRRVMLNFEAVDYRCRVWLNNVEVGQHVGGNNPFRLDITTAVQDGENHLVVRVQDATGGAQLRGKQRLDPRGIWYDPDRLAAVLARLREYDADLQRFGLRDRDIEQRTSFGMATRFVIIEGTLALVLAPLAAVSLVVFGLPYWITGQISRRAPDLQSRATWQVASGVVTNGILITILALGVFTWLGSRAAVSAGVGLTLLAFAGLAAFERERSVLLTIRAFLALQLTPLKARARLKRQRAALATVLEQVQAWLETRAGTRS